MAELVGAGATRHAGGVGLGGGALDEELDLGAEEGAVGFQADAFLELEEALEAVFDHLGWDLVGHGGGFGAGAGGVLEGEGGVEPGLRDQVEGVGEVGFGLAREADDDVGGEGDTGDGGAEAGEDLQVAATAVAAAHQAQDTVRAGLEREVDVLAQGTAGGHGLDHVVAEVLGVGAGEAEALQALDPVQGSEEVTEQLAVAGQVGAVGVHVLAEEADLEDAGVGEGLDLGDHVADSAAALLAAQLGDDAEGAGVVAADADRHPGRPLARPPGREGGGEALHLVEELGLGGALVAGPAEQDGQAVQVVGAEHDVDPGGALQHPPLVLLGEAAADGDGQAATGFGRGQVAEGPVQLVVGVLADRAGVEHDQVGVVQPGRRLQALGLQQPGQALGVVLVHLAPEGADQEALAHRVRMVPLTWRTRCCGSREPP